MSHCATLPSTFPQVDFPSASGCQQETQLVLKSKQTAPQPSVKWRHFAGHAAPQALHSFSLSGSLRLLPFLRLPHCQLAACDVTRMEVSRMERDSDGSVSDGSDQ